VSEEEEEEEEESIQSLQAALSIVCVEALRLPQSMTKPKLR
jgi:hypothetical protein